MNVQFRGFIQMLGDIFPVFLSLADTFCKKIFDLSVDRTKIIFSPCGNGII